MGIVSQNHRASATPPCPANRFDNGGSLARVADADHHGLRPDVLRGKDLSIGILNCDSRDAQAQQPLRGPARHDSRGSDAEKNNSAAVQYDLGYPRQYTLVKDALCI